MKKLNKKQRREIYLKVASALPEKIAPIFGYSLCHELMRAITKGDEYEYHDAVLIFPEFALFQPEVEEGFDSKWWDEKDKQPRIDCMLLCAEMCKP